MTDKGSSPLARGALLENDEVALLPGIIPACAGSTSWRRANRLCDWDHPRLRGEHFHNADAQ